MTFLLKSVFFLFFRTQKQTYIDIHSQGFPPVLLCKYQVGERDPTAHTEIYPLDKTTDRKKFKRTAWADFYSGRPQRGCTPPPPPILSSAFFLDIFVYQDICGMPCRINGDVSRDARRDIFFFFPFLKKKRDTIPPVDFVFPFERSNLHGQPI
jgi:hypothetical protein